MSRRQIGFVFSNSTHSTRFGFRASDFRQKAGKLGLIGFELALFSRSQKPKKSS